MTCLAQSSAAPVFKSGDLQADAAILRSAYEQLHPGLYRYSSKAEMDEDFAVLNHQLARDQSLQDAFLAFSEFAAKIRTNVISAASTNASPYLRSSPRTCIVLSTLLLPA